MDAFSQPGRQPTPARVEGRRSRLPDGNVVPRRVADLATTQDGVITRTQLRTLGLVDDTVDSWLRRGWLHAMHETVFAVGHRAVTTRARFVAALLAAGDDAALSHVSAAIHRRLLRWELREIDVMVPRGGERYRDGIQFHRPRVFGAEDVDDVDGIACTTVGRTLVDLAAVLTASQLERAVSRAEYLGVLDDKEVVGVLERIRRPRGVTNLRRILTRERLFGAAVESELERAYAQAVAATGPIPQVRFRLGPERWGRVDFYWPRQRLVVEVDGPHHALPVFARADERRDRELRRQGLHVERFDDDAVEHHLDAAVARTLTLLSSRDDIAV